MRPFRCPQSVEEVGYHTKKKSIGYKERDEKARDEFRQTIATIPEELAVYVDETGIDQCLYRPYDRALRGVPVQEKISGKKYQRTSVVAGQCGKDIIAALQYSGTMDSRLFLMWFQTILLPLVNAGCVIVMDNARFHQKKALCEMAKQAGCQVLFLPPYSPDLNRIETFWAWLKNRLRSILTRFSSLDDAISDCFMVA